MTINEELVLFICTICLVLKSVTENSYRLATDRSCDCAQPLWNKLIYYSSTNYFELFEFSNFQPYLFSFNQTFLLFIFFAFGITLGILDSLMKGMIIPVHSLSQCLVSTFICLALLQVPIFHPSVNKTDQCFFSTLRRKIFKPNNSLYCSYGRKQQYTKQIGSKHLPASKEGIWFRQFIFVRRVAFLNCLEELWMSIPKGEEDTGHLQVGDIMEEAG